MLVTFIFSVFMLVLDTFFSHFVMNIFICFYLKKKICRVFFHCVFLSFSNISVSNFSTFYIPVNFFIIFIRTLIFLYFQFSF